MEDVLIAHLLSGAHGIAGPLPVICVEHRVRSVVLDHNHVSLRREDILGEHLQLLVFMMMSMLDRYFSFIWPVAPTSRCKTRKEFVTSSFIYRFRWKTTGRSEPGLASMLSSSGAPGSCIWALGCFRQTLSAPRWQTSSL